MAPDPDADMEAPPGEDSRASPPARRRLDSEGTARATKVAEDPAMEEAIKEMEQLEVDESDKKKGKKAPQLKSRVEAIEQRLRAAESCIDRIADIQSQDKITIHPAKKLSSSECEEKARLLRTHAMGLPEVAQVIVSKFSMFITTKDSTQRAGLQDKLFHYTREHGLPLRVEIYRGESRNNVQKLPEITFRSVKLELQAQECWPPEEKFWTRWPRDVARPGFSIYMGEQLLVAGVFEDSTMVVHVRNSCKIWGYELKAATVIGRTQNVGHLLQNFPYKVVYQEATEGQLRAMADQEADALKEQEAKGKGKGKANNGKGKGATQGTKDKGTYGKWKHNNVVVAAVPVSAAGAGAAGSAGVGVGGAAS